MTDRYYNPGQTGSFGGLPIAERYLNENVKDFLIRQDAYTLHRLLDIALDVVKYLLKGLTTCGRRIS